MGYKSTKAFFKALKIKEVSEKLDGFKKMDG